MSNFLEKFKSGVSEASNRAKVMVDVNRLKLQIAQKHKEICEEHEIIGQIVYELFEHQETENLEERVTEHCQKIYDMKKEIGELELKILDLNEEKECPACKKVVPIDSKFCPSCGYRFPEVVQVVEDGEEVEVRKCSACGASILGHDKFCAECGAEVE